MEAIRAWVRVGFRVRRGAFSQGWWSEHLRKAQQSPNPAFELSSSLVGRCSVEGQSFERASEHGWNWGAASISCHWDRAGHLCVHTDCKDVTVKFQPQRVQHSGSFLAAGSLQPQESWLRGPEGASCLQSPGSAQRGEAETGKNKLGCNHSTDIKPC